MTLYEIDQCIKELEREAILRVFSNSESRMIGQKLDAFAKARKKIIKGLIKSVEICEI